MSANRKIKMIKIKMDPMLYSAIRNTMESNQNKNQNTGLHIKNQNQHPIPHWSLSFDQHNTPRGGPNTWKL